MSGYGTNDIEASPKTGGPYGKNDIAAGDKPSGVLSRAADFGIDALKGAIELPEAGVGLADLVTGGYAGKAAEGLGFRPKEAKDYLNTLYSPERQAANQEVQQAQGFLPTVGAMVKNPSTIIGSAVESAPSMLGAGGIARGVMKYAPALSPIIAGAAGEGAVSAGQNAEQVRQEDPNGTLTAGQSAILAGSGALTGAIGAGAGKFANKLGIGDVETMLASGKLGPVGEEAAQAGAKKGLLRKAGEGFATEGALQELPQSYQEQVAQNLAQGKPWDEGAAAAGAQGLLVGGAMGGGGAVLSSEGHTAPEGNTPADAAPYSSATDDRPESVNYQRNQLALDEQPPEVAPQFTPLEDSEISARQAAYAKQAWVAQQNTNRATETPDDEIYRSVGGHGQESAPLSQQMGLDPAAGPMSAAAALAVDSGAHQSMLQQAAQGQEKSGEKWHADTVDSSTGEVDRSAELQGRLDFLNQQAKVTGWNKPMVDQRDQIQSELASAPAQQGALDLGPTAASTTTQKPSIPAAEKGISSPSTTSLQEQSNGTQAAQAQQAVPQPAQAGTTAQPGAVTNAAPTANPLKKAGPATSQEAQTQSQAPQDPGVQWNAMPPEQRGAVLTQSGSWNTKSGALNVIGKRLTNTSWEDIPEKAKNALQGVLVPTQAQASSENTAAQSAASTPASPAVPPGKKAEASEASSATAQESLTAQTDAAAHEAATSPQNNKPSPTPAQIEAGNYEKGHIQIHGLDITVENPRGSVRSGKREDGSTWSHEMSDHYGYIRRTTGADGEHVDVYVGPHVDSDRVYVVDQLKDGKSGFDEHKVMLGFSSKDEAVAAYRSNFDEGWKVGPVTEMSVDEFKGWLKDGDTTKPVADQRLRDGDRNAEGLVFREGRWHRDDAHGENRAEQATTRSRPRSAIVLKKPLVGPSGAALTEYVWQWKPFEFVDATGEDRVGRMSDWEKAESSSETGRNVVHQFAVRMPDGNTKIVSAESAMSLLGYTKASQGTGFKSVTSAAKTLARLQMQLEEVKSAKIAFEKDKADVLSLTTPAAVNDKDSPDHWRMGDGWVVQNPKLYPHQKPGELLPERLKVLEGAWRENRMRERGWSGMDQTFGQKIDDIQRRIARAQKKLDQAGADGEQVDVYVGPKPTSGRVFVVDQLNQQTGGFDEHKAMLGYSSKVSAVAAYRKNFDKGWKVGPVQSMTIPQFKAWLKNGDTTKPISAKEGEVGTATNAEAAPAGAQQQKKESDHGLQKRRREGQVAPENEGQGGSGGTDSPAASEKEAPRARGVLAKAKEAQAAKLAKATEILGANVGDIVVLNKDYDYLKSGEHYLIENIGKSGHVSFRRHDTGSETHLTLSNLLTAQRQGVTFTKQEVPAQDEKLPVKTTASPASESSTASGSKTPLMDSHVDLLKRVRDGNATADQIRESFSRIESNREALSVELNTMNKEDLLRSGGYSFAMQNRSKKKAEVVNALTDAVLDEYSLGRTYGPRSFSVSANGLANYRKDKAAALRELVSNLTDDDIAQYANQVAEARAELKGRRDAVKRAMENPQTLDDFRTVISNYMEKYGDTNHQAYLRLTPEQRQRHDELGAEATKSMREASKAKQRTQVATAGQKTTGEVIATKHTKYGHDLYVVRLAERVSREDYNTLNSSAKSMGGSYSSYRGNGAVPGFQFRTREAAEAFGKLVSGDDSDAKIVAQARRDAFDEDRSQSAAERLRTMAEALNERADESLSLERKANTARRARFAASAEGAARADKALAGTMNNLAAAIEAGTAKFLDAVRQKVQVEALGQYLRNAKNAQIRAKYGSYAEQERHRGEPIDAETVDYAEFPTYSAMRSDLASIARQMVEIDGLKKMGQRLMSMADDVSDAYLSWAKENQLSVSRFIRGDQMADFPSKDAAERSIRRSGLTGKAIVLPVKRGQNRIILSPGEAMKLGLWSGDGDKRITLSSAFGREIVEALGRRAGGKIRLPWSLESTLEKRKRLEGMGIYTAPEFRSALREFSNLQESIGAPDKIKQMERDLIGRRADGLDFFPTSEAVVDSMLDAAEIKEGMDVLEPSAGMGHIADAIREKTGAEPDVVEISGERRKLLEAKGYNLAGDDFMAMEPRKFFTFGDIFRAPDGTEGIMHGGRAWSGRASLSAINEDGTEGRMLGWYDRDELTGIRQRGSWSGYDRIVMNPPFSKGRDIQHVRHAYELLRPGGRLVAIMGEGAFFHNNQTSENFREWLDGLDATSEKLPEGSFMDPSLPVNTSVNARMVVIDKPKGKLEGPGAPSFRSGISPADKAIYGMASDKSSAKDVLSFISKASRNPFNRQLAKLLMRTGLETKIDVGDGKGWKFDAGNNRSYAAAYSLKEDKAYLFRPGDAERHTLHELVHAATMKAIRKGGLASIQMRALFRTVQKSRQLAGMYGMENVDEFVAEAFTNPDFQRALKQVSAPGTSGVKNAWNWLVRIIKGILGLPAKSENALSAALDLGVGLMRENMQAPASREGIAYSQSAMKSTDANIARGMASMTKALTEQTTVHRAMFRNGLGWVDFVWGDAKRGIAHIIERRMSSDQMGRQEVERMLTDSIVETIARGRELRRAELGENVRLALEHNQNEAILVRTPGSNAWMLTAFKIKPGAAVGSATQSGATRGAPIRSRDSSVAGDSIVTQPEENSNDPDIRYSLDNPRHYVNSAVQTLNDSLNFPGKLSWWHKTVGTMYNLAERSPSFKKVFDSAQGFVDDVSHYASDAADHAPRWLPRLDSWKDLSKSPVGTEDNKAVAKPIFEGTLSWGRDLAGKPVPIQDLVDAAGKMDTDEKARRLEGSGNISPAMLNAWKALPLDQYMKQVESRYESKMLQPGVVWSDAELRGMFGLNDHQISLYREFREAADRSLNTLAMADMLRYGGEDTKVVRQAVMEMDNAHEAAVYLRDYLSDLAAKDPEREAHLMAMANGMIDRANKVDDLQEKGYAPLSRFGKYTVDVVDKGERQYFGLFETAREASQMAAQMKKEYGDGAVTQGTLSEEAYKLFAGVTPESLELFGNMLGLNSTGDDAQDKAFQEYLRLTKTNRSAMRRLIHRQGIAGFSQDVGRVLASFIYSNSRQTAAGLNIGDLGDAVNDIPKEQGELKDAAIKLSDYIKNPQEEAQNVRGLLFAQYLGGSVASAFVNMLQPVQVTFPWLSQFGGAKAAAGQLTRAAGQVIKKSHQFEPDLARALKIAEEDGTVSPQEIHQLMRQANGAAALRSGDGTKVGDLRAKAHNAFTRLSVAWGNVFSLAEQFNRRVTFVAAYRTAKAEGMPDPSEFARQAVKETQFLYSKANKMVWGRGAIGGTLMTFKSYSISYLELLHRMYTQGGPEGKRAVLLALGTLMLMSGASGLPFEEDLEDLLTGLGQKLGYNFNAKQSKREFLADVFGKDGADIIDSGISGLPGMPMDVSGRLGLGNLIPGTGLATAKQDHTRDVLEIVGPVGDMASRVFKGADAALSGDLAGAVSQVMPKAVSNMAKGADMANTGMYRDDKGYKVIDTNPAEAGMKAFGFQPKSVADIQEANAINQQQKSYYNLRAQEIRAKWADGIFEGDPAKVAEARGDISSWNEKNPDQPMVIKLNSVWKRVREMRKSKDERIADTAPRVMRSKMRQDAAQAMD